MMVERCMVKVGERVDVVVIGKEKGLELYAAIKVGIKSSTLRDESRH